MKISRHYNHKMKKVLEQLSQHLASLLRLWNTPEAQKFSLRVQHYLALVTNFIDITNERTHILHQDGLPSSGVVELEPP
jgi:hypothetical protein